MGKGHLPFAHCLIFYLGRGDKYMGKYIAKKNWLICAVIFLTGILSLIVGDAVFKAQVYDQISNDLYLPGVSYFRQSVPLSFNEVSLLMGESFVSKHIDVTTRAICFASNSYYLPVTEGRFFSQVDFSNRSPVCVIGTDLRERCYQRDNVSYINYNGVEYAVIGTIGLSMVSKLDTMLILNMLSVPESLSSERVMVFGDDNIRVVNRLLELDKLAGFEQFYQASEGIQAIWNTVSIYTFLSGFVYLTVLLGVALMVEIKNRGYGEMIRVQHILGRTKQQIFGRILLTESLLYGFFYLSGNCVPALIGSTTLTYASRLPAAYLIALVIGMGAPIITNVITFAVNYRRVIGEATYDL